MNKTKTEKQTWTYGEGGITLLQYYAGQALVGLLINNVDASESYTKAAAWSFDQAEAMIKEAEKRSQ